MTTIRLSWPAKELWPNRSSGHHWARKASLARKAKSDAVWACMEARAPREAPTGLVVSLHPPRKPGLTNLDNAIAANKHAIDGLAAYWGVDDSALRIRWPETWAEPVKGGAVVVEVAG